MSPKKKDQQNNKKIEDCGNAKFSRDAPRHVRITNSITSMISTDAIPTNVVNREGLNNLLSTVEPLYIVPGYSAFFCSVIPKLKNAVSSFQQEKINKALERVKLMGFSLDCKDVEQSAVLSFTIYFYKLVKKRLRSETSLRKNHVVCPSVHPSKPLTLLGGPKSGRRVSTGTLSTCPQLERCRRVPNSNVVDVSPT